jgi:hypothetical protein
MGSKPFARCPAGRGGLLTQLRHRSVVYRHTLPRSSLQREQTAPGATNLLPKDTP